MAKQTFTTGQVLTAAQMTSLQQTAMGGGSTTAKTASYTLVAADAGTVVQMNSASSTTITVNTALFAAGDTVTIQNVGAGVCTITAGTATVSTSATLALKQYDGGQLYFNTTSAALFFASDAADGSSTTFVGCSLQKATQSLANNTYTALSFNVETNDSDGFHDNTTNNSRVTIPAGKAGRYLLISTVSWDQSNGVGGRFIGFALNGTLLTSTAIGEGVGGVPAATLILTYSAIVNLSVADYVEVYAKQVSGGALSVNGNASGTGITNFNVTYLGA